MSRFSDRLSRTIGYSRSWAISLAAALLCGSTLAAPPAKTPDANAKPRKIYAHYMGCFVPGTGAIYCHAHSGLAVMDCPKQVRDPDPMKRNLAAWAKGNPGGTYRNFALAPFDRRLSDEEAADLEIRRAMRIGLDGFTFDAWAGGENGKKLFETMMKVCKDKGYDFELTITPDASCLGKSDHGVRGSYIREIKWLLDTYGDHPNLARRDGKPLIMGYQSAWPWVQYLHDYATEKGLKGDAVQAEVMRLRACEEGWKLVGPAFKSMEKEIGHEIYWEFCYSSFFNRVHKLPKGALVDAARIIAGDLPAVGLFMWTDGTPDIAKAVVNAGAEWSEPIRLQYENYGYFQTASPGTDWLRGNWQRAREVPSTLMQYITWNDYHETTNLTPGINSRYAYYDLTGYFIEWWKTGKEPKVDHDKVYLFSHKYPFGSKIYPFKNIKQRKNVIEVLTILTEPAEVRVPGRTFADGKPAVWTAPAGMSFKQLPLTPGEVQAQVTRGGEVVVDLKLPEPVGTRPFRPDIGKVAICTEFGRHWKADFGDAKPYVYAEYADADADGLPNWFEMLWFGTFGDMSTASVADPKADPDKDGKTNLQEYLDQTDPTRPN